MLKTQLANSLKLIGIGVPFVLVPGASIIMPILIRVAGKHNITLIPEGFSHPENTDAQIS